jgi:uncharacterized protein YyaL (SSP411 family)
VVNRLASETSAYLLQHQHNPVDWYAWGEEALERARREGRPLLVSIGYSSCHWCHVMERESFEDPAVARLMNESLVCIKVDREERPDVDQIYMDTIVRLTGSGGWPLNVFCTPDGKPFFGGTYFPPSRAYGRASWTEVVEAIARAWRERPAELEAQAAEISAALERRPELAAAAPPGRAALTGLCRTLMERADRDWGGFGDAPKFPTPTNLEALLLAGGLGAATAGAREHVLLTLKRMARGGIYDQLGGGFHRYSTDAHWLVPHFEKMLYDQGQLLRVYAEAWRQTGDGELVWPIEETIGWLEREMRSPEGGFYASLDADSEGEEGRFYVWTPEQLEAVLGGEAAGRFASAYGVVRGGNFEHTGASVLAHAMAGPRPRFAAERSALLAARERRERPARDEKQIAAWIGYAIGGIASAAGILGRGDWTESAARAAEFVQTRLFDPATGLLRIWDGRGARIPGFLDDHAALLAALLDLHRASGDARLVDRAISLAEAIAGRFRDAASGELFFAPANDPTLVFRPRSDSDGATPSAAGLAVLGLVRLGGLTGRDDLLAIARRAIEHEAPLAARVPHAVPTLLRAAALLERGPAVAVVFGDPRDPRAAALAARARVLLGVEDAVVPVPPEGAPKWLDAGWVEGRAAVGGEPTAYLCVGTACSLPATTPGALSLPPGAAEL